MIFDEIYVFLENAWDDPYTAAARRLADEAPSAIRSEEG